MATWRGEREGRPWSSPSERKGRAPSVGWLLGPAPRCSSWSVTLFLAGLEPLQADPVPRSVGGGQEACESQSIAGAELSCLGSGEGGPFAAGLMESLDFLPWRQGPEPGSAGASGCWCPSLHPTAPPACPHKSLLQQQQ